MSYKVLVVDDNKTIADTLAKLLEILGYKVATAYSGEEMFDKLAKKPKLVLLDIGLPVVDGYELAKKIRNEKKFSDIVLVALTGYGQPEDRVKAEEAGFDHHLTKPAFVEDLRSILDLYKK